MMDHKHTVTSGRPIGLEVTPGLRDQPPGRSSPSRVGADAGEAARTFVEDDGSGLLPPAELAAVLRSSESPASGERVPLPDSKVLADYYRPRALGDGEHELVVGEETFLLNDGSPEALAKIDAAGRRACLEVGARQCCTGLCANICCGVGCGIARSLCHLGALSCHPVGWVIMTGSCLLTSMCCNYRAASACAPLIGNQTGCSERASRWGCFTAMTCCTLAAPTLNVGLHHTLNGDVCGNDVFWQLLADGAGRAVAARAANLCRGCCDQGVLDGCATTVHALPVQYEVADPDIDLQAPRLQVMDLDGEASSGQSASKPESKESKESKESRESDTKARHPLGYAEHIYRKHLVGGVFMASSYGAATQLGSTGLSEEAGLHSPFATPVGSFDPPPVGDTLGEAALGAIGEQICSPALACVLGASNHRMNAKAVKDTPGAVLQVRPGKGLGVIRGNVRRLAAGDKAALDKAKLNASTRAATSVTGDVMAAAASIGDEDVGDALFVHETLTAAGALGKMPAELRYTVSVILAKLPKAEEDTDAALRAFQAGLTKYEEAVREKGSAQNIEAVSVAKRKLDAAKKEKAAHLDRLEKAYVQALVDACQAGDLGALRTLHSRLGEALTRAAAVRSDYPHVNPRFDGRFDDPIRVHESHEWSADKSLALREQKAAQSVGRSPGRDAWSAAASQRDAPDAHGGLASQFVPALESKMPRIGDDRSALKPRRQRHTPSALASDRRQTPPVTPESPKDSKSQRTEIESVDLLPGSVSDTPPTPPKPQ